MSNENSNINENDGKTVEKSQSLTPEEKEERRENIIVTTILWLTTVGLFILVIGVIWRIKDLFTETGWQEFLLLAPQTKIFIIGLILLGIFFLTLFLVVLFKRGKRSMHSMLFRDKYEEMSKDETYMPAKVITAGTLICIFTIFLGLIIAIMGFFLSGDGDDPLNLWGWIDGMTGGAKILLVGGSILTLDGLIYGFVYTWVNGQWVVINQILKYNKAVEDKHTFDKNQNITGKVTFGIIVAEILMIVIGLIWAIIDAAFSDFGEEFRNYPVGIQISFYGIFGALLFTTLIFSMFFYKRGNNLILTALFVQINPKDIEKDNISAKIITIGILVSITMMVLGLIIWILSLIITAVAESDTGNIFTTLAGMSGGLALLSYSVIAEVFTILTLSFSFFLHNGYAFTMDKIIKMEASLDGGLEDGKQKADEKKAERKKLRKMKKEQKKKEKNAKKK